MIDFIKRSFTMVLPHFLALWIERRQQWKARDKEYNELLGGDSALFTKIVTSPKIYGEYGCGQSTLWVLNNTDCPIYSVDSTAQWVDHVLEQGEDHPRLHMAAIDLGPVGEWGRPLSYDQRAHIPDYLFSIWQRAEKPNVVLIDGRFRVACFLTSLLEAAPGTEILFDDYKDRAHYHIVEELLPPQEFCGRMAYFVVPAYIDKGKANELLQKFLYVMD